MDISQKRLSNGITSASVRLPGFNSVFVGVYVRVGSRYEAIEHLGIAHFFEHMAFKGTRNRDAYRISFDIERAGGDINAHTAKDHTGYTVRLPGDQLAIGVELLADILQESTIPAVELVRERQVILQEMNEANDDPETLAQDRMDYAAFAPHPLANPIIGRRGTLRAIDRTAIRRFLRRFYTGENMVLVAVGGLRHEQFHALAKKHFHSVPPGALNRAAQAQFRGGYRHYRGDFGQCWIQIGLPAPGRQDRDYPLYELLTELIGGGTSSPLFQVLREQNGLAYAVSAMIESFGEIGIAQISAGVGSRHVGKALELIAEVLAGLSRKITTDDFDRALNQYRAQCYGRAERPAVLAESIALDLLAHQRVVTMAERIKRAEEATPELLAQRLGTMLQSKPAIGIVGRARPSRLLERFADRLRR
jgi:predicted Zn-dependent peptidase